MDKDLENILSSYRGSLRDEMKQHLGEHFRAHNISNPEQLVAILDAIAGVQKELVARVQTTKVDAVSARSYLYKLQRQMVATGTLPAPAPELVQRFNEYVSILGLPHRLPSNATAKQIAAAYASAVKEAYKRNVVRSSVEPFYRAAERLASELQNQAQVDAKIKNALESLGIVLRPVDEDLGGNVNLRKLFHFRANDKNLSLLLQKIFPYDFPRQGLEHEGLRWYELPRNITAETAYEAETGAPVVKLKSSSASKRLARSLGEGHYLRVVNQHLDWQQVLARKDLRRQASARERIIKAFADVTKTEPRNVSQDYLGRELIERGTGDLWEVVGTTKSGALRLQLKLADPSQYWLEPPEKFSVRQVVERVTGIATPPPPEPILPVAESPVPFVAADHEKARVLRDKLLKIINDETSADMVATGKNLSYSAARLKNLEVFLMAPVKQFIVTHPRWLSRFDSTESRIAEDLAQELNVHLMEYADVWLSRHDIKEIDSGVYKRFLEDWMAAANRDMYRLVFRANARFSGMDEDAIQRAWSLLKEVVPGDYQITSTADIIKLAEVARKKLKPAEYNLLAPLLSATESELSDVLTFDRGEVISLNAPVLRSEADAEKFAERTVEDIIATQENAHEIVETFDEQLSGYGRNVEETAIENVYRERGYFDSAEEFVKANLDRIVSGRMTPETFKRFRLIRNELQLLYGEDLGQAIANYSEYQYLNRRLRALGGSGSAQARKIQERVVALENYLAAPWSPVQFKSQEELYRFWKSQLPEEGWRVVSSNNEPLVAKEVTEGLIKGSAGGKSVYFGVRRPEVTIYPENIYSKFYWSGYQGSVPLPFLRSLETPTFSFQNNMQSINQTLRNVSNLKEGQTVAVLDLETTTLPGLEELKNRPGLFGVTEIAARKYRYTGSRLEPVEGGTFRAFVRPTAEQEFYIQELERRAAAGESLSQFEQDYLANIRRVGGLQRLVERGYSEETAYQALGRFLANVDVLAGQNVVGFDIPQVLRPRMGKYASVLAKPVIDLVHLAAYTHPREPGNLAYLVNQYGTESTKAAYASGAHEALTDVNATGELLGLQIARAKDYLAKATPLYSGDYLVHHRSGPGAMPRGVYRVLNYLPDENTLELLRTSTNEYYRLQGKSPAELEHLLYSQFMHVGSEYPAEIDALFTADRASRRVRAAMTDLREAQRLIKRYDALEAYAAKAGVSLTDIRELSTDVLRELDEEQRKTLLPLQEMPSLLRNQQAAYDWYVNEFKPIHRQFVEQLARNGSEDAQQLYQRYYERLAQAHPYRQITRVAYPWEQRLVLPNIVHGHSVSL